MKKQTKSQKVKAKPFQWEKLTWEDLSQWTDVRSLERGRTYQRKGAVSNLSILPTGDLLADVIGTQRYVTHISLTGQNTDLSKCFTSNCSCPVGHRCKHGVAVILECLTSIENGTKIPATDQNDRRLVLIDNEYELDSWEDDDDEPDFEDAPPKKANPKAATSKSKTWKAVPSSKTKRSKRKITEADIASFLSEKSKEDLVDIILQVCRSDAKIKQAYVDKIRLETGDHTAMIQEAQAELRSVTSEEAWYNQWKGYGNLPDYSRLQGLLQTLVDAQQFDAVVELGRELVQRGIQQIAGSQDEGETADQLMSTISIVAQAIGGCSLPDSEKILFAIDSVLEDDWDLCHSFERILEQRFAKPTWAQVAKTLIARLPSASTGETKQASKDFIRSYQRELLSGWAITALDQSGDEAAATDFCIQEAKIGGTYQRAVDRLVKLKQYDEATELASLGLQNTDPKYRGLIRHLQDSLATIAAKNKDHSVGAAIAAGRFVSNPSVSSLQDLLDSAKKAKCQTQTKAVAMKYLETGKLPTFTKDASASARKTKKKASTQTNRWPFPPPPGDNSRQVGQQTNQPKPHFSVLTRLSIKQGDPNSTIAWYDKYKASKTSNHFRFQDLEIEVADAVALTHPDRAVEFYCAEAERLAAETKTQLYPKSIVFLKKARTTLKLQNREHEFQTILTDFHDRHKRKIRLVELLRSLQGKPIIKKRGSK